MKDVGTRTQFLQLQVQAHQKRGQKSSSSPAMGSLRPGPYEGDEGGNVGEVSVLLNSFLPVRYLVTRRIV